MNKIQKAAKEYLNIYLALENFKAKPLYKAVDEFDKWFIKEMPIMAYKMLQFNGDALSIKTSPDDVIKLTEIITKQAKDTLLPVIISWTYDYFDDFYKAGIDLANVNLSLIKNSTPVKFDEDDKLMIENLCRQEINVWKNHFSKMTRQTQRELWGAIYTGKTFDFFLARMTTPDLHIVGFSYGNSRYSWYEHIKRYAVGRPKMIAATAQKRKMSNVWS